MEPHSVVVSARTGAGVEELLQAIEDALPRDEREMHVLLPYDRGDLVARVHDLGEVLAQEHTAEGTALHVRVPERVAAELEPYASVRV
jgi:GTP-binding protein HflX